MLVLLMEVAPDAARAQLASVGQVDVVPYEVSSGPMSNPDDTEQVVFHERIEVEGADWIRIRFSNVSLVEDGRLEIAGASGQVQVIRAADVPADGRILSAMWGAGVLDLSLVLEPGGVSAGIATEELHVGSQGGATPASARDLWNERRSHSRSNPGPLHRTHDRS